jgi:hypothetical protein
LSAIISMAAGKIEKNGTPCTLKKITRSNQPGPAVTSDFSLVHRLHMCAWTIHVAANTNGVVIYGERGINRSFYFFLGALFPLLLLNHWAAFLCLACMRYHWYHLVLS